LNEYRDSLLNLDIQLADTTLSDSVRYLSMTKKEELADVVATLSSQYKSGLQGIQALKENQRLYLQTENGLLPSPESYQQNENIMNDIYLKTVAKHSINFSPEQISNLEDIAYQCPLSGGKAVYQARSIYSIINPQASYNDKALCLEEGLLYRQGTTHVEENKDLEPSIHLYPNPATDQVHLTWEGLDAGMGELWIWDNMGRLKQRQTIDLSQRKGLDIVTESLSEGIYHLQLHCKQGIFPKKLILLP
jgi:hypothetical protein